MNKYHHNYYDLLQVTKDATPEEIKTAYHDMMKAFHPDANVDVDEKTRVRMHDKCKLINEAYECLKDKGRRRKYDMDYFSISSDTSGNEETRPKSRIKHIAFIFSGLVLTANIVVFVLWIMAGRQSGKYLERCPLSYEQEEILPGFYTFIDSNGEQKAAEVELMQGSYCLTVRSEYAPQTYSFTLSPDGKLSSNDWKSAIAYYRPATGSVTIELILKNESKCELYK